jgi:hypothetical protein
VRAGSFQHRREQRARVKLVVNNEDAQTTQGAIAIARIGDSARILD